MLEIFYPKRMAESAYEIPYKKLYDSGIRGVIFDIDNTLVPRLIKGLFLCLRTFTAWA